MRTETADAVLDQARRIAQEIDELRASAADADGKLSGIVYVAGPHALIADFVAGHLMPFRRAYPRVRVALRAEFGVELMLRGEADIGLRISMPVSDRLDIRRIGDCQFGLYGNARLAAQMTQALPKVNRHKRRMSTTLTIMRKCRRRAGSESCSAGRPRSCRRMPHRSCWRRPKRVSGLPPSPATLAIAHRVSKPIVTAISGPNEGLFIVTRREQRGVARVRVLVDFLTRTIAANQSVFGGNAVPRRSMQRPQSRGD